MPGDLRDPRWMYAKAVGFVVIGMLAGAIVLMEAPRARVAALLLIVAWAAARAYYFCFYVIERYIDPEYRFDGLVSVARYVLSGRARRAARRTRG